MARCESPSARSQQVIIMGMSRSGTSLTASIVATLLGRQPYSWRGNGRPLPADTHNRLGYFERQDVVMLNHALTSAMNNQGFGGWTVFPPSFGENPSIWIRSTVSSTAAWRKQTGFDSKAASIIHDMNMHSPWVLKDVRFARTLPAWRPLLENPVCIIPYRNPTEVLSSSAVRSVDRCGK